MSKPLPISDEEAQHLIHDAFVRLGWKADAKRLANRIARLHLGLPREDEFAVICTWLNRCALIHKLDQRESQAVNFSQFKVPDLLAVFMVDGKEVTVLIEVKAKKKEDFLSFRPDYYEGLKRYASLLKLPILIAWKYHGIWTLFDIEHMALARTNYNIRFSKALSEGLLGVLAGDFTYSLAKGAGVHLQMRKEKLISKKKSEGSIEEQWQVRFDDVYFTDGLGNKRRTLPGQIESLFHAHNLDDFEEHTETHMTMHFTVGEDQNKFAHMSLVGLLNWQAPVGEDINWRSVAINPQAFTHITDFTSTIDDALREKIVTHVLHLQPATKPSFLK